MTLLQLKALLAVIDTGSFSRGALELDTSQSTVSYAVAELERELNVRLLERGRFGAVPTEVGLRVAEHARRMLQCEAAIEQEVTLTRGLVQGTVRVAAFRSVASKIMPAVMAQLRATHPALQVKLMEEAHDEEARCALREGRTDAAFVQDPFPSEFISWELLRDPYVALLPKSDGFVGETLSWQSLKTCPLILYSDQDCARRVQGYVREAGLPLSSSYQVKEDSTILSMVAEGLGVSIVPALTVEHVPESVRLAHLDKPPERIIGVAITPGSLKVPAVRVFLSALKRRFPASDLPSFEISTETQTSTTT